MCLPWFMFSMGLGYNNNNKKQHIWICNAVQSLALSTDTSGHCSSRYICRP